MIDRILELPTPVRVAMFVVVAAAVIALGVMTTRTPSPTPDTEVPSSSTDTEATDNSTGTVVVEPPPDFDAEPQEDPTMGEATKNVRLELDMPVAERDLQRAAESAVEFTQLYQSYRYSQDDEEKVNDIERLLADVNAINLDSLIPTGSLRDQYVQDETSIAVVVNAVELVLISEFNLAMRVATTSTTTTNNADPAVIESSYGVNLVREGNTSWKVAEFNLEGDASPFQDETVPTDVN